MIKKIFIILLAISVGFALVASRVQADDNLDAKQHEIEELEKKIQDLQGEQKTLSSAITYLDTKIALTQSQISKTQVELKGLESDIATLSGKINTLNTSLDGLSTLLLKRINATYKRNSVNPMTLLFSSTGFTDFLNRIKYLRLIQYHDRRILYATEQARANYDAQKAIKEQKQAEVEALNAKLVAQKSTVARQQYEKRSLLLETKNSEKEYQNRLAKAVAELAAIQGIIAGRGSESKVRDVNEGEKIASVISGASACSTGSHLHFEVVKSQTHQNPFNFLSSKSFSWDNADSPQNGSGSWNWPLNDPLRVTQGYGNTSYSSRYANNVHTGVDMVGSNSDVKAVKHGTLYRGGIGCGGGTLQYVRVDHADDDYDTYYLHVNYI